MNARATTPHGGFHRREFLRVIAAAAAAGAPLPALSVEAASKARVEKTARAELAAALEGHPAPRETVLALWDDVPAAHPLAERGLLRLPQLPKGQDAFEYLLHEGCLYVLGTTPRGLLHAVFALRAALQEGALREGLQGAGSFHFRERVFHARFDRWPGERADVRFLAHLGATHCLASHDWQGEHRSLQGYVTSPIFPEAVDAASVAGNRVALRRLLDDCADFGLGAMLWLAELPCQGGPWAPAATRARFLERFPAEVLSDSGTYEGRVLCFGHPRVQEFYRDLLARFFAEFPEIECLFVFSLDSGGEFCDPQSCPRCRGLSRLDQRDRHLRFLIEEGGRVRPGLRVLTTGWEWDREGDRFLEHQAALPAQAGLYLAAQKDGWQCERQEHDFLRAARAVCARQGQTFLGYDNLLWGDDSVHGLGDIQDFPLGIAAKLRRWQRLGVDGVFDHWGGWPEDLSCNAMACREFFLDPEADAETVCRRLAERQFGPAAGPHVFAAWQALERAHARLSLACTWTPAQWPMWYLSRKRPPLPGSFPSDELRARQLPPRPDGATHEYSTSDFATALRAVAEAWQEAAPHMEESARQLAEAATIVKADEAPLFYRFWYNGERPSPSRAAHLRRQQLYVESGVVVGREIGLQFGLHALWESLGRNQDAFRAQARAELQADAEACRSAARYFDKIPARKTWPEEYTAKAEAIDAYLRGT